MVIALYSRSNGAVHGSPQRLLFMARGLHGPKVTLLALARCKAMTSCQ